MIKERIRCSAVWFPSGIIYVGKRHSDCFEKASEMKEPKTSERKHQGFMTTNNVFVDRVTAAEIAIESGQIKKLKYSDTDLYSEDLY